MSIPDQVSNNKRIAKNTLVLYVRMFFTLLVGLYTSRVVLATLGVTDYGIYGLVGGVVALFGFLNGSMSGATSRFLTFELGRGDQIRLEKTFASALLVHIAVAIMVLVLAETVGLWFVCCKLNIPEERMCAAQWVYQLSIASSMLAITQIPFNAGIIAHEKMDFFAYVELLNSVLKLVIVYLLAVGNSDKLIVYACLTFCVSVIIISIYCAYCARHFLECRFKMIWNKDIVKPLLSFSGWNLFGNFGSVMEQQGSNIVINKFFSVAMNGSLSIGLTVANVVNSFAANIITAFRPQITKSYAQGKVEEMQGYTNLAIKLILLIYSIIAIPTFVEANTLLSLWLVEVPDHATNFCRLLLVSIYFETLRYILIINLHASGNVRRTSASTGVTLTLVPVVMYVLYLEGVDVEYGIALYTLANIVLSILNLVFIKHYIHAVKLRLYAITILRTTGVCALVALVMFMLGSLLMASYLRIVFTTLVSTILLSLLSFAFCLDKNQRHALCDFIKSKIHCF